MSRPSHLKERTLCAKLFVTSRKASRTGCAPTKIGSFDHPMSKQTPVKLDDLEFALMFVDGASDFGNTAWVCRQTGAVLCHSDEFDEFGPLPDDIDDVDRYVVVPDKREFELGKPLALEFARTHLPACYEQVREIFSHRGAYPRFKDLLERQQSLDAWHQWEAEQTKQALRARCADNGVTLAD